jgi:hypothetical protein
MANQPMTVHPKKRLRRRMRVTSWPRRTARMVGRK